MLSALCVAGSSVCNVCLWTVFFIPLAYKSYHGRGYVPAVLPPEVQWLKAALAWLGGYVEPLIYVIKTAAEISPLVETLLSRSEEWRTRGFPPYMGGTAPAVQIAKWMAEMLPMQKWHTYLTKLELDFPDVQRLPAYPQLDLVSPVQKNLCVISSLYFLPCLIDFLTDLAIESTWTIVAPCLLNPLIISRGLMP